MTSLVPLPAEGDPHARLLAAYLDGLRSPLTACATSNEVAQDG